MARFTSHMDRAADRWWISSYRRWSYCLLVFVAVLAGMSHDTSALPQVLLAFAAGSSIAPWCFLDAEMHGKVFHRSYAWSMMFTYPVGILIYLVWTRRAKGIWHSLLGLLA